MPNSYPDNPRTPSTDAAPTPLRPSWETPRVQPVPRAVPAALPARPAQLAPSQPAAPAYVPPPAPSYGASLDTAVQYDLAGNPIAGAGPSAVPAAAPSPYGSPTGNAPGGVWPPPIGGAGQNGGGGAQIYSNNSGSQSHLPPEIERLRWHWGAFFFPTYWTRRHGLRSVAFMIVGGLFMLRVLRGVIPPTNTALFIAACVLYAVSMLGIKVYFGLNGHKIGWRNRHFPGGLEQYFQVQNRWMWWGFGINVFGAVVLIAVIAGSLLLGHSLGTQSFGGSGHGFGTPSGYSGKTN